MHFMSAVLFLTVWDCCLREMSEAFYLNSLPNEGCWKMRYEAEVYRLKTRKKVLYTENREIHAGLRMLLWSRYAGVWYIRHLNKETLEENIYYYQSYGWLWVYPTDENKQAIREDVKKNKMGYWPLMEKRQAEMDHQRHIQDANRGDGYKYKEMMFRKKRYNK